MSLEADTAFRDRTPDHAVAAIADENLRCRIAIFGRSLIKASATARFKT